MTTGVALEYRVLGPLEIRREGEVVRLGSAKQRALVAVLLLSRGEVVSMDRLVDALWGEEQPAKARHTLQVYVSQLRKALSADAIETHANGYRIRIGDGELDAVRFANALQEAVAALENERPSEAAQQAEEALTFWRGPALADLAYESFAAQEINRLEEMRMTAIETLMDAALACGRHQELVAELQRLVTEHPLRERLQAALMKSLYRTGRQAEALQVYQETREHFRDELGIDPSPELQELHRKILNHDESLSVPASSQTPASFLPANLDLLIGRRDELAEIADALHSPNTRLLTLTGPGGAGKTRLALESARLLHDEFSDGVFFVDLAAISEPELVLPTVAQALGLRETGVEPLQTAVHRYLENRRLLLVLDNFEQLLASAPLVAKLLRHSSVLKILCTSRSLLRVGGEYEYAVPALAETDAVALFAERARAFDSSFHDHPAAAEICRRLDGLPLAIELAAARTKLLSAEELLARLDRRLPMLTEGGRDSPERHQTLRATIEWSYDLLSDKERRLFEWLGVFVGGWTVDAAEAICAATDLSTDVVDGLTVLLDNNLIRRQQRIGVSSRFAMLETIHEFARERLDQGGEADMLGDRHSAYFCDLADIAEPQLTGADQGHWLDLLDSDHDNLRTALNWSRDAGEPRFAAAASLGRFWYVRGYLAEGRRWLEETLRLSDSEAEPRRIKALDELSYLVAATGDHDRVQSAAEEQLACSRQLNDLVGVGRSLCNLGVAEHIRGELPKASALYSESIKVLRTVRAPHALGTSLMNLGAVALAERELRTARTLCEEGLSLFRTVNDSFLIAMCLENLGWAAFLEERTPDAAAFFGEGLKLAVELGHKEIWSYCLEGMAASTCRLGPPRETARLLGQAAAVREAIGAWLQPFEQGIHDETVRAVREQLDGSTFDEAFAEGATLTPQDALNYSLELS